MSSFSPQKKEARKKTEKTGSSSANVKVAYVAYPSEGQMTLTKLPIGALYKSEEPAERCTANYLSQSS